MIIKDESAEGFEWPRDFVPMPDKWRRRKLTEKERAVWMEFERLYGPIVIGDQAGNEFDVKLPSLSTVGWCALYPLAIYFLRSLSTNIDVQVMTCPRSQWLTWDALFAEFWKRRKRQIEAFRTFLVDWELDEAFKTSNPGKAEIYEAPFKDDRKVLGLHRFEKWNEVADYALRWTSNPSIRDTTLWQHRLTVSRGIDLICSELLANGFQHRGVKSAEVFIMAKLCSPESSWRALQMHKQFDHLTESEVKYFNLAKNSGCPILQLCIGDGGRGFAGNASLSAKYAKLYNTTQIDEAELIRFALSGRVSTKTREDHRVFWKDQTAKPNHNIPTNHGLSEVLRYIRRVHAYWRIHSGAKAIEHDFLPSSNSESSHSTPGRVVDASPIQGCIHYFMLPLLPEGHFPIPKTTKVTSSTTGFRLIDAAEDALVHDSLDVKVKSPENWVGHFCERIIQAKEESSTPLLVHLGIFESFNDRDLEDICLDLVHCLYHVRDEIAVVLSGVSEKTRYQLLKYIGCKNFEIEYRILPFLDFEIGDGILYLGCSETTEKIRDRLTRVLSGGPKEEVASSKNPDWDLFRRVHAQNQGLFQITRTETGEIFRSQISISLSNRETLRFAFGGWSFLQFAELLSRYQAVAPHSKRGYFQLGKMLQSYVHLGRVWADVTFRSQVLTWLKLSLFHARTRQNAITNNTNELVILAILHPAIELAHDLIRNPAFTQVEVVEIRRLSELRWDHERLLKVRGKRIAILIDVISSGRTVASTIEALRFLGFDVLGCFAMLSIGSRKLAVDQYAFCQCTWETLLQLSNVKGKDPL